MIIERNIDNLINPENYQSTFNLNPFSCDIYKNLYKKLVLIREVELKIAEERKSGRIGGPIHLSAGQEAIPVGVSHYLNKDDYVFGAHRSHAHILSLGTSVRRLFAEILGRSTGLSKGYGGSMHLIDESVGFMGSVPIVAGTVSLAVGAGLAISRKKSNSVSISYLGDGAVEEGVFHESLNLAKINNLPVIFIIENNLFSSHMDINLRQPSLFTSRFAEANLINYKIVDGNNILEVMKASEDLIRDARNSNQPGLIEAITYRWFGHVDWREDIDVGNNRCKKTLESWKKRCPIKRLRNSLIEQNIFTQEYLEKLNSEIVEQINKDWEIALNDPLPDKTNLFDNVFLDQK